MIIATFKRPKKFNIDRITEKKKLQSLCISKKGEIQRKNLCSLVHRVANRSLCDVTPCIISIEFENVGS